MKRLMQVCVVPGILLTITSGCAINLAKRSPWDIQQLAELSDQLEQFKTLAQLKSEEANRLRHAKDMLGKDLSSSEANVGYDERGVVARMLDSVLFDSGKAQLRPGAHRVLDKVAKVLNEVPTQPVAVEGHTDNVPIKHSGWADNKALSLARANAVIEYLERRGVPANHLVATGYGEDKPIASNENAAGRQRNRRVEVVILPQSSGGSGEDSSGRTTYTK